MLQILFSDVNYLTSGFV